jgi:hypothetical protein
MHKFYALSLGACLLAGCSQFTTSNEESASLEAAATAQGDAYVSCVTQNGLSYTGQSSGEISTVMQVATAACQPALDSFKSAQDAFLSTQIMMTDKALAESVEALNERAKSEIAQQLVNKTVAPALAPAAATAVAASTATAAAAPVNSAPSTTVWTAEQRIYLDCMEEQAKKYSGLNESATVVADVAQSRCRSYQGGASAALEQEGRARVMGLIMDAKLTKPGT